MRVYHDFSLLPGSRSTFPEVDPTRIRPNDTDPTGSSETLVNTIVKVKFRCVLEGSFIGPYYNKYKYWPRLRSITTQSVVRSSGCWFQISLCSVCIQLA